VKIAIGISGQPRTWRHAYKTLFDYFAGHELDVYMHLWDEEPAAERREIFDAYSPVATTIDARPQFLSEKKVMATLFPVAPAFYAIDMFYGVSSALHLALESERSAEYDLFCRTRFDAIFDGVWPGHAPPAGAVLTQAGPINLEGGCNDQFALGRREAMAAYAGVSAWLPTGMTRLTDPWFRPEMALQYYLASHCRLQIIRAPIAFKLLRSEQVGRAFDDLDDEPMFHARKHEAWREFAHEHFGDRFAAGLNFNHYAQTPLALDRWLDGLPDDRGRRIPELDWPERLVAIDALLAEQTGGLPMDADKHRLARLVCAALIHRMARDAPMGRESCVVHALSQNRLDVDRARSWLEADPSRGEAVDSLLPSVPVLSAALAFAPCFEQETTMGWRMK
jgi:hypothetical protein